jgi:cyclic-di-GMP-binding protein
MPSFDVVSQVDMQEVRNAVDQASREISNRFDFKDTDSTIDLAGTEITLHSNTDQKLKALVQVMEEKLVKRSVPLKALAYGKVQEASKGAARQVITLNVGISDEKAREINKFIKAEAPKGVASQVQGDQLRVTGKKRDDLQATIAALKGHDFDVPLQFVNFRD